MFRDTTHTSLNARRNDSVPSTWSIDRGGIRGKSKEGRTKGPWESTPPRHSAACIPRSWIRSMRASEGRARRRDSEREREHLILIRGKYSPSGNVGRAGRRSRPCRRAYGTRRTSRRPRSPRWNASSPPAAARRRTCRAAGPRISASRESKTTSRQRVVVRPGLDVKNDDDDDVGDDAPLRLSVSAATQERVVPSSREIVRLFSPSRSLTVSYAERSRNVSVAIHDHIPARGFARHWRRAVATLRCAAPTVAFERASSLGRACALVSRVARAHGLRKRAIEMNLRAPTCMNHSHMYLRTERFPSSNCRAWCKCFV